MKRKLARPGDKISFTYRQGEHLSGRVTKKASDYLFVALDSPRHLEDWERELPGTSDPMQCTVYVHSDYIIEEYGANVHR